MSIQHTEIASIRQDYVLSSLNESDVLEDPFQQFEKWFNEALHAQVMEVNAMSLSTVGVQNKPSSRIVLLKDIKSNGLSFFTNYSSRKAREISANPCVSALFFWPELQRQVRLEGIVERLPESDSDEYFSSRPRSSRVGAIASPQSSTLSSREDLEQRVKQVELEYANKEVIPRPLNWGGFLIRPNVFEFWQGRSSRLHDRIVYQLVAENWTIKRIAP